MSDVKVVSLGWITMVGCGECTVTIKENAYGEFEIEGSDLKFISHEAAVSWAVEFAQNHA